ncbi:MAG: Lpg1974 family pore-forming outer membrane protein [Pirellulales bacterium]|nr:Lpg1974 family pore-forming outer membrane protein [Pirellulales bacterium]
MIIKSWKTAALLACIQFQLFCPSIAIGQRQDVYDTANYAAEMAGASLTSYNTDGNDSYESNHCGYTTCGPSCSDTCPEGGGLRQGQFYIGAEYLYVRSTFSQATAFVERTSLGIPGSVNQVVNQFVEMDFDYGSSYRFFGGYRLCECGCDLQFAFTRYQSDSFSSFPGVDPTSLPPEVVSIERFGEDGTLANTPNTRLDVAGNVDLQTYDLAFSKTIPLGGCCCEPCCDACCDSCCGNCCDSCCGGGACCGPACCAAWDITWSAGVRFADVAWDRSINSITTNVGQPNRSYATRMEFNGAGPRWGLEGRRYFGRNYRLALFAKGDISLLLGDVNIVNNLDSLPARQTLFESTQLIPVVDIVVGGSVYIGNRVTLNSGYLFSAWHDLGMRDSSQALADDTGMTFDDANILGFDGWFARGEFAF